MTKKADTLIARLGEPAGWTDPKNEEQGHTTPLYDRAQLEKLMVLMIAEFEEVLTRHRGEDTGQLSYRLEDHFKG